MENYGNFYVSFDDLGREHFEISDVWVEFYEGEELDDIPGVPFDWLDKNLIQPSLGSECPPYYNVLPQMNLRKREFLVMATRFRLGRRDEELSGYLFLSGGEVSSVGIFVGEVVVHLYCSDLLVEDNLETLDFLNIDSDANGGEYNIEYDRSGSIIKGLDGVVTFPLIEPE